MNRKAFTLIEFLAVIMLLGILSGIAVVSYNRQLISGREKAFLLAENSFQDAISEAYVDCNTNFSDKVFCINHSEPISIGEADIVRLEELINDGYINPIKNPYDTNQECDKSKSYVKVVGNVDMNETENNDLSYNVCLVCGSKKSAGCN